MLTSILLLTALHNSGHQGAAKPAVQTENQAEWALMRKKVKHVFVLYQENRSFDFYFGTFPGANGIYSQPPSKTPGFNQPYIGLDGKTHILNPFRIGPKEYAADVGDLNHSHPGLYEKMDVVDGKPRMDKFSLVEEQRDLKNGIPSKRRYDLALLAMSHVDGDTIPFLWHWADRFVLCDHIFQVISGPSTPGNLTIIAAQTGVSQWIEHLQEAPSKESHGSGVPVLIDLNPFWGSKFDKTDPALKMPYNPDELAGTRVSQINLTYPTIPLTMTGKQMGEVAKSDRDPEGDLGDIKKDVSYLTEKGHAQIPWGWYQEGFDNEPNDIHSSDPLDNQGLHASYVTHHDGPQYFGYIANNPEMSKNLHGINDMFKALDNGTLPDQGVFYVKGGYENVLGLKPACPDKKAQSEFVGDDGHPGYSDSQISEALLATTINKIAKSKYWKDCAIIITWDDSDGQYDHVPPPLSTKGPDGTYISDGPRVPMIVISPFTKNHYVFHGAGDQASVVKFVDRLFNRTPLADLPEERELRKKGAAMGIQDAGPRDDLTSGVTDLLGCFDINRLLGKVPPLSASIAEIPESIVRVLPQYSGYGLKNLHIVPTDKAKNIPNHIPEGFTARP